MFWRRKELSPRRRAVRKAVWIVFFTILVVRFGFLREYYAEYHREMQREARQERMARERRGEWGRGGGGGGGGRRERPPIPVRQAQTAVPDKFPRLQIQIAPTEVAVLRKYQWNGWSGEQVERPKVVVTVVEGGTTYTNVFLNLKGSAGSFRHFDDKPALTLDFAKGVKGRTFRGYPKISLNNSAQDDSYICEIISREMFEAAGVPATRASHATVLINGRDLGLYVMTEGFGKSFLRRHFKDVSGNLYDSGFCRDIDAGLDTNSGDHPEDHSDLKALVQAAIEPDPVLRRERLEKVLDLERFMTFLALESLTCHWDGYSMNRNNYRVFSDHETGKMVFIPHGMDQMFGIRRASPQSGILPPVRSLLSYSVMTLPGMEMELVRRIAELRHKLLEPSEVVPRVQEISDSLRPTLAAYGKDFVERHDRAVDELITRIQERAVSVTQQLDAIATGGISARYSGPRQGGMRGPPREWR